MRVRLCVGLVVMIGCSGFLGCMTEAAPLLSAQDPAVRAAILAANRGAPLEAQVRAQVEEQEPKNNVPGPGERSVDEGPRPAARIAALVNGEAILEEEVHASTAQQMASVAGLIESERAAKTKEIYTNALNTLIEREVVIQDAKNKLGDRSDKIMRKLQEYADKEFRKTWIRPIMEGNGFKTEEQLVDALEKSGTSFKSVKYAWQRQFMATEYLRNRVIDILSRIGHLDIEQYYRSHPDEFTVSDSLIWQDLFIDATRHPTRDAAKRFAESLLQRIRNGEDFAKLAETFDNGEAHLRKDSEGEGRERGKIRPIEVEEPLFRLKEKEMAPPIETPTGFHIVRLLERTYAGKKPFDQKVQKQIREKLRAELASKEMKKIVSELKATAIIEYPK